MALAGFFLLLGMLYWARQLQRSGELDRPTNPVKHRPPTPRTTLQDPIREAYRSFEERMQNWVCQGLLRQAQPGSRRMFRPDSPGSEMR